MFSLFSNLYSYFHGKLYGVLWWCLARMAFEPESFSWHYLHEQKRKYLKCPAIGDKQNKWWSIFMKEHLWSLDIRLLKFMRWHMKMPTIYHLVKKKITKQYVQCGSNFIKQPKRKKQKRWKRYIIQNSQRLSGQWNTG